MPGKALAEPEPACDRRAALPGDDVRADLRQPSLGKVREALVQLARDCQLEHAVAEELEALVGGRAVDRPRGVREDVLQPLGRQPVEQPLELADPDGGLAATGET